MFNGDFAAVRRKRIAPSVTVIGRGNGPDEIDWCRKVDTLMVNVPNAFRFCLSDAPQITMLEDRQDMMPAGEQEIVEVSSHKITALEPLSIGSSRLRTKRME